MGTAASNLASTLTKEEIGNYIVSSLGSEYEQYSGLFAANGVDGGLLGSLISKQEFQEDVLDELLIVNETHRGVLTQQFSKHFLDGQDEKTIQFQPRARSSSFCCTTSTHTATTATSSQLSVSSSRSQIRRVNSAEGQTDDDASRAQELKELRVNFKRLQQQHRQLVQRSNSFHSRRSPKSCQEPVAKKGKVAIVLTDIEGSTALWEADCIAMREALTLHNTIIRTVSEEHYGYEIGTEGDAYFLAFREAPDALRFGLRVQEELNGAPWADNILALPFAKEDPATGRKGLRVRVTIHMGDVEAVKNQVNGRTQYEGPAMRVTRKLESLTLGGQILTTLETWMAALRVEPHDPCLLRAHQAPLGSKEHDELCRLGISKPIMEVAPVHLNLMTATSQRVLANKSFNFSSGAEKSRPLPEPMLSCNPTA